MVPAEGESDGGDESDGDRASLMGDTEAPPELTVEELALLESKNAVRQFDRMVELIRTGTAPGAKFKLRPSTLNDLNGVVIEGMRPAPGAFRTGPIIGIIGSTHTPPDWREVPGFVDDMCDYVNENWTTRSPIHLSAYVMWRLNWIHPFPDGNGRTSRASSYLVMCVKLGYLIPGHITIPQRIAANKKPYYRALEQADAADKAGRVDVSAMEAILEELLEAQLRDVRSEATGRRIPTPLPPGPAWGAD